MARFVVRGNSMEPTLEWGQHLLVSRLAYRIRKPARDDLAIVRHPLRHGFLLVKRVVGIPGDNIRLETGALVINNIVVSTTHEVLQSNAQWHLAGDEYFVSGDRTDGSADSRAFGPVPRSLFLGKVRSPRRRGPGGRGQVIRLHLRPVLSQRS